MNTEPHCADCGVLYREMGADIVFPHDQWELISRGDSILCGSCIAKRAAKLPGVISLCVQFRTADHNPIQENRKMLFPHLTREQIRESARKSAERLKRAFSIEDHCGAPEGSFAEHVKQHPDPDNLSWLIKMGGQSSKTSSMWRKENDQCL